MSSPSLCVVGMGNILYRDEGVGVYAARCLERAFRFDPEIVIADGAAMGFGVIDIFDDCSTVLVLDGILTDQPPGTIYRLGAEQLLHLAPSVRMTAHEVEPLQLLQLSPVFTEPPEMVLLGIVPAETSEMEVGLTPQLEAAFPRFVEAVVAELRDRGIHAEQIRPIALGDVIGSLVTCAQ
jgi:hydrogenase maturation protease